MAQQQADALALLAETALHHGIDPGAPGERYQVVVHVDAGQSVLEDGTRVPAGTSRRLACDASRVVMRHGCDGRVMEVAARTRTIPPALRRALLACVAERFGDGDAATQRLTSPGRPSAPDRSPAAPRSSPP